MHQQIHSLLPGHVEAFNKQLAGQARLGPQLREEASQLPSGPAHDSQLQQRADSSLG